MSQLPALYLLGKEYLEVVEKLADMDLPPEVVADTLEAVKFPVEQKAASVVMFGRSLEACADSIEAEVARMQLRAKAYRNRAQSLMDYTRREMERLGIQKIEAPQFALRIQQNPESVEVFDEAQVPIEFMRQPEPPPMKVDKKAVAAAVKAGQDVPGCRIIRSTRLVIK